MPIFRASKNAKIALQHLIIFGVWASPWTTLKTEKRKFAFSWEMKSVSGHHNKADKIVHVACLWVKKHAVYFFYLFFFTFLNICYDFFFETSSDVLVPIEPCFAKQTISFVLSLFFKKVSNGKKRDKIQNRTRLNQQQQQKKRMIENQNGAVLWKHMNKRSVMNWDHRERKTWLKLRVLRLQR